MKIFVLLVCLFGLSAGELPAYILLDILKIITHVPLIDGEPTEVNGSDVTFHFFNRTNPETPILITDENIGIIDTTKTVKYIVHGWTENRERNWYRNLTEEYLEKYDCQVIQVDWSKPAYKGYPESAQNTRGVGKIIAAHVLKTKVPLSMVHLVGHSLGGQTVAFAGKHIQTLTRGRKVDRITALDPAGPLFNFKQPEERIHKTDATFVDIIHTDTTFFGYLNSDGNIDFYPNKGLVVQPGCPNFSWVTSLDDLIEMGSNAVFCSHHQSYKMFIETMNGPSYLGKLCSLYGIFALGLCNNNPDALFGEDVYRYSHEGRYYFDTTPWPF